MNQLKVKIVKCSKRNAWYANKIGNIYNVSPDYCDEGRYFVHEVGLYVMKEDVEILQ